VTNGIDLEQFSATASSAPSIRRELGVADDCVLIVSVSRATIFKGIGRVISAAAMLKSWRPQAKVRFVHCGDGPDLKVFSEQIRALNLDDSFTLLGPRDDVASILKRADIAVHASEGEGLCLAILEFMAAGLPTIVPDIWSVCQSIEDRKTGLWYRHNDLGSLAEALDRLVSDSSLRAELGSRAKAVAFRDYDINLSLGSLVRVIDEAVR
jgi:glycosyltransferase involved in cell wall biosynthesis